MPYKNDHLFYYLVVTMIHRDMKNDTLDTPLSKDPNINLSFYYFFLSLIIYIYIYLLHQCESIE